MMQTEVPDGLLSALNETETLEIEIVERGRIRRAPVSAAAKLIGATVTMALADWVETDKKMWELYNLVELAIHQRDEAHETLRAMELENELLGSRLREWKTYARGIEERLHRAQLRNVELVYGLRRIADVARQAILAPTFSFGLKSQLLERFNQIAKELG